MSTDTSTMKRDYYETLGVQKGADADALKKAFRKLAMDCHPDRHPGDKTAEQFGFVMPLNSDWFAVLDEFFKANGGYTNTQQYKSILSRHLGETGVKLLQSANK